MSNCAISLVASTTDKSAFGVGEILMYTNGETRANGDLVFHDVDIEVTMLRDLIWKHCESGSTRISIPDLGLEGELVVTDDVISFNGSNYQTVREKFEDYVFVSA
jgi:hypothetical protein